MLKRHQVGCGTLLLVLGLFSLAIVTPSGRAMTLGSLYSLTSPDGRLWIVDQLEENGRESAPFLGLALRDDDDRVRDKAGDALEKLGPAGIPSFAHALEDSNDSVVSSALSSLRNIHAKALEIERDKDGTLRSQAGEDYHSYNAQTMIGPLLGILAHSHAGLSQRALHMLKEVDAALGYDLTVDELESRVLGDRQERRGSARYLGYLCRLDKPDHSRVMPLLAKLLKDKDPVVRRFAARSCEAVPASAVGWISGNLIQGLEDTDFHTYLAVHDALGGLYGKNPEAALEAMKVSSVSLRKVRLFASFARDHGSSQRAVCLGALTEACRSADKDQRLASFEGLVGVLEFSAHWSSSDVESSWQLLVEGLSDEEAECRMAALEALDQVWEKVPECLRVSSKTAHERLTSDLDPEVKDLATWILKNREGA